MSLLHTCTMSGASAHLKWLDYDASKFRPWDSRQPSSQLRRFLRPTGQGSQPHPLPAGAKCLELGCGTGASCIFLARECGHQVVGVDLAPLAIAEAAAAAAAAGVAHPLQPGYLASVRPPGMVTDLSGSQQVQEVAGGQAEQSLNPAGGGRDQGLPAAVQASNTLQASNTVQASSTMQASSTVQFSSTVQASSIVQEGCECSTELPLPGRVLFLQHDIFALPQPFSWEAAEQLAQQVGTPAVPPMAEMAAGTTEGAKTGSAGGLEGGPALAQETAAGAVRAPAPAPDTAASGGAAAAAAAPPPSSTLAPVPGATAAAITCHEGSSPPPPQPSVFDFVYDCQCFHALRDVGPPGHYTQLLASSLKPGGLLMLLAGAAQDEPAQPQTQPKSQPQPQTHSTASPRPPDAPERTTPPGGASDDTPSSTTKAPGARLLATSSESEPHGIAAPRQAAGSCSEAKPLGPPRLSEEELRAAFAPPAWEWVWLRLDRFDATPHYTSTMPAPPRAWWGLVRRTAAGLTTV
ncbi:hypothetical protein V8C86DRAFT_719912 [Haematococcus lacustris]